MSQELSFKPWSRAIILVDMNAFFASIEQKDNSHWRGQPLAVTNGAEGSCIITASYEARAYGIKTGMRMREAKVLCPHLIRVAARPHRYVQVSTEIMNALDSITPDREVFSIDEAFLDVTRCQRLYGSPETIALKAKNLVKEVSGLTCSVGVSGDKTTAKYAAELYKPDGFAVIYPWEAEEKLASVPVNKLCGIGNGMMRFLNNYGVYYCGDMKKLPISVLGKRFGNIGRRIWYMCQGADPTPVMTHVSEPQSLGHGKILPPNTKSERVIRSYLRHMCEKVAARLRRNHLQAQYFFIGLRSHQWGWFGDKQRLAIPTQDGEEIFHFGEAIIASYWQGEGVDQIQVTALDPHPVGSQLDMFTHVDAKQSALNCVMDEINQRYGAYSLTPATLLERSKTQGVIAPAWKPSGSRQSL